MAPGKNVFIEASDFYDTKPEGEEVTLMAWGSVVLGGHGPGGTLQGKLNPGGSLKGTRKLTWLADCADNTPVTLVTIDPRFLKFNLSEGH